MTLGTQFADLARGERADPPIVALGTMTFGDTTDEPTAVAVIEAAFDAGVRHLDTANGYARGASEEILGRWLAKRRDQITLATKAGIPHPDAQGHAPLSPVGLRRSVEGSLRRLRTDRIDLLYLHQPDRATPLAETLTEVDRLVDEGKVGALGVSNFAAWQTAQILCITAALQLPQPIVAQQVYSLIARRLEDEHQEFATTTGIATMAYNPLAGGLLAHAKSGDAPPVEGRFSTSLLAGMYRERYWTDGMRAALGALRDLASEVGVPLREMALRWLIGRVDAVLLGASRQEHVTENLSALARGPLAPEVLDRCDTVGAMLRGSMPKYNR